MRKKKSFTEDLDKERTEITDFLTREETLLRDYTRYLALRGRDPEEKIAEIIFFIREGRYRDKPGSLSLLIDTHRELMRETMGVETATIIERIEERYLKYHAALNREDYL